MFFSLLNTIPYINCYIFQVKEIPFSMRIEEETNPGIAAMKRASQIAQENGISEMSLDEINAEIAAARESK